MRRNTTANVAVILTLVLGAAFTTFSAKAEAGAENAIRAAARQNHYAFVTFFKSNDNASKEMLADVKSIQGKYANRADFISVNVGDRSNRGIISQYGADRSPIPLTIVIAPNGAITAGFPRQINTSKLSDAFVSDGTAAVLKVLQGRKIAAVCLQSARTKNNKQCQTTARGVKSDSRLGGAIEIIKIDPTDRSESKLLRQWNVNADSANAQLVIIAPPGKVVGKFDGAASKDSVMSSLMRSLSGGCSGGSCGPGGCK